MCNKVKCFTSLTPSCSSLLCSHGLQVNSFLNRDTLIRRICLGLEFYKNSSASSEEMREICIVYQRLSGPHGQTHIN